jgi:hypothetical protein
MAETKSKGKTKSRGKTKSKQTASPEVTFKCSLCEKQKPIADMKVIRRYRPVIFVCHDCEKTIQ